MTHVRKFAWVGLVGLGIASLGCGSKSGSTGTGGSNGSGGSSATGGKGGGSATGGSNGNGGSSSSGGSSAGGAGGAGATLGCSASDPPMSADIADFASGALDGGLEITGGIFSYGDNPQPTYTLMPGSIEWTDAVVASPTKIHYQGFGFFFNAGAAGTDCTDATSYTGIQFDISGSLMGGAGCTMQFSINDSEHADSTVLKTAGDDASGPNDPKAAGPMGAYAPQVAVMPSQITTAPTTIQVPFSGTGPEVPLGGKPADTAIDTMKIEGVQWQMTVPQVADGSPPECDLDVKITNVKFYK